MQGYRLPAALGLRQLMGTARAKRRSLCLPRRRTLSHQRPIHAGRTPLLPHSPVQTLLRTARHNWKAAQSRLPRSCTQALLRTARGSQRAARHQMPGNRMRTPPSIARSSWRAAQPQLPRRCTWTLRRIAHSSWIGAWMPLLKVAAFAEGLLLAALQVRQRRFQQLSAMAKSWAKNVTFLRIVRRWKGPQLWTHSPSAQQSPLTASHHWKRLSTRRGVHWGRHAKRT
mmetsp:Transcript_9046/g.25264  ORF Transcript_9046/g.25264 Transcript_9046/m.25264 type:complete len:227 (+) Transcript_9046:626-1306(+)